MNVHANMFNFTLSSTPMPAARLQTTAPIRSAVNANVISIVTA